MIYKIIMIILMLTIINNLSDLNNKIEEIQVINLEAKDKYKNGYIIKNVLFGKKYISLSEEVEGGK